jgi:hypothetical protein
MPAKTCPIKYARFAKVHLVGAKRGESVGMMSNIAANDAEEANKLQICGLQQ